MATSLSKCRSTHSSDFVRVYSSDDAGDGFALTYSQYHGLPSVVKPTPTSLASTRTLGFQVLAAMTRDDIYQIDSSSNVACTEPFPSTVVGQPDNGEDSDSMDMATASINSKSETATRNLAGSWRWWGCIRCLDFANGVWRYVQMNVMKGG